MRKSSKLTGKVKNGVIPLPPGLKLAKPRNWQRDFALNHGHCVKGHPKK